MCVAENTLREVSVELSVENGQPRHRAQRIFLEKVANYFFENFKKERQLKSCLSFFGASSGIRTPDTLLKRQVLCQLS